MVEKASSSNDLNFLQNIYQQIDRFKGSFNIFTEPIITNAMKNIIKEIFTFNLNINPSEEDFKNIENNLCRLVAVSQYIHFDEILSQVELNELQEFTTNSWNNSKIIDNSKAYICILNTKLLIECMAHIIDTKNNNLALRLDEEIKLFFVSLYDIIIPDFSQENLYLCKTVFSSICEIVCWIRSDWIALCDNLALGLIVLQPMQESALLEMEIFLIEFVFKQKIVTTDPKERFMIIKHKTEMLKFWRKMFECNNSLPISTISNQIFMHIVTVSFP